MSKSVNPTELHYRKRSFRYAVMHFDLNRANRRALAAREKGRNGKLLTPEARNAPYLKQVSSDA